MLIGAESRYGALLDNRSLVWCSWVQNLFFVETLYLRIFGKTAKFEKFVINNQFIINRDFLKIKCFLLLSY